MEISILTYDADPDHGGFGARVDGLVRSFAAFADVRVILTDWFGGKHVPGVVYEECPLPETRATRLKRLRTYYRTDFPSIRHHFGDIVVVETLELWGMVSRTQGPPRILDEHNVYWEVLKYEMGRSPFFSTGLGRSAVVQRALQPYLWRRAKRYEVTAIRGADATLVTSEADRARLLEELPELSPRVRIVPNTVAVERYPDFSVMETTDEVLFVGNFNYAPNQQAATYVMRHLASQLPQARFLLVGAGAPSVPATLPNVSAPGHVADLNEILKRASVCVAPLLHGSGTRLKILTYLASGKAVVATTKAAEGLEVVDGTHLLLRDDPDGFRGAVRALLGNPDLRHVLGENGRRLVRERYDWRTNVAPLRELAERLCPPPTA